jgi:putative ABC transport system permease protein
LHTITNAKYAGPVFKEIMGASMEDLEHLGNRYNYFTQPLTDIRLRSEMPFEMEVGGNITMVYVFMLIALFILVIASIDAAGSICFYFPERELLRCIL